MTFAVSGVATWNSTQYHNGKGYHIEGRKCSSNLVIIRPDTNRSIKRHAVKSTGMDGRRVFVHLGVYQCWPDPPPLDGPAALGAGPLEKD